jgi:UDP-N-acetylglucosamine acyltransferase
MATIIHPTAIIHQQAIIEDGCEIGPYCVIGPGVRLLPGCKLLSHIVVEGPTTVGRNNIFHPFCSIGGRSQDLKYTTEPTYLEIGDNNRFREACTVNRATAPGGTTRVGSHNNFLAYCHIAHDCTVGDHCIFSNNATLAGHVTVEDHVVIGGLTAVHQFCRLGRMAMLGGCTKIVQDVAPYTIADGNPAAARALNTVGLDRNHVSQTSREALQAAFKLLYKSGLNTTQALEKILALDPCPPEVQHLADFVRSSQRGIIK